MSIVEGHFPPDLIAPSVAAGFPAGYTVRPLARHDYTKGFLECLQVLSDTGPVTEAQFLERYDWIAQHGKGVHYHVVIEEHGRIVGTGALIVERKLWVPLIPSVDPRAISRYRPLLLTSSSQYPPPRDRGPY